jgi:hypothetical protein
MHFPYSVYVLWINSLYMFWALFSHLQKALQNNNWYIACNYVCRILVATNRHNTHTIYQVLFCGTSWRWASNAQNMYRLLIHNKLNTQSASRWIYYTGTRILRSIKHCSILLLLFYICTGTYFSDNVVILGPLKCEKLKLKMQHSLLVVRFIFPVIQYILSILLRH